jgi:hypothetical protein
MKLKKSTKINYTIAISDKHRLRRGPGRIILGVLAFATILHTSAWILFKGKEIPSHNTPQIDFRTRGRRLWGYRSSWPWCWIDFRARCHDESVDHPLPFQDANIQVTLDSSHMFVPGGIVEMQTQISVASTFGQDRHSNFVYNPKALTYQSNEEGDWMIGVIRWWMGGSLGVGAIFTLWELSSCLWGVSSLGTNSRLEPAGAASV